MDYSVVTLEYKHELDVDDDEPSDYVKEIEGQVFKHLESRKVEIGTFRIFIMDLERTVGDQYSGFDVFDYRAETVGYWSLYQGGLRFKNKVINVLRDGDRWSPNMLILDRLELQPEHRGQGLGLVILRALQRQFSMGCGIIAMKPYPLQFEGRFDPSQPEAPEVAKEKDREFKRAISKLRAYYARLGFVRVPGTYYMVADPFWHLPRLDMATAAVGGGAE